MSKQWHCVTCGKEMRPFVLWSCDEDDAPRERGETVINDHFHIANVEPGDGAAFLLKAPIPRGQPRPFVPEQEAD